MERYSLHYCEQLTLAEQRKHGLKPMDPSDQRLELTQLFFMRLANQFKLISASEQIDLGAAVLNCSLEACPRLVGQGVSLELHLFFFF